jgi:hypothetical protein
MKKSVVESIMYEVESRDGSRVIDYQPGNMTRYLVCFQSVDTDIAAALGYQADAATLVCFFNLPGRPCHLVPAERGYYLSLDYFMEKTGIREGDARVLLPLLQHVLGIGVGTD